MKNYDFKTKTKTLMPAELAAKAKELSALIAATRLALAARKTKNLRLVFQTRKQLAVVKTLLNKIT